MQIREILTLAASRLGAVNFGENLDASTSDLLLKILKMTLSEFSIRALNYKHYEQTISGKNPIIIGFDPITSTSGDILEKPAKIEKIIYEMGNINYPLEIRPYEDYRELPLNNVASIPTNAYIDYDYPFIKIYTFPNATTNLIRILGKSYLISNEMTQNDYLEIPEEMLEGVVCNLALKSAGYFGITASQSLIIEASSGLKHIKQLQLMRNRTPLKNDSGNGSNSIFMGF